MNVDSQTRFHLPTNKAELSERLGWLALASLDFPNEIIDLEGVEICSDFMIDAARKFIKDEYSQERLVELIETMRFHFRNNDEDAAGEAIIEAKEVIWDSSKRLRLVK